MEFKRFKEPLTNVIEYEGTQYYFVGYLMPDENIVLRVRPVTNWVRSNGLIGPNNEVYLPFSKKGE